MAKKKSDESLTWESFLSSENVYKNAEEDELGAEVDYWMDSGAYALNMLVSGSFFKGLPGNGNVTLAGEYATGKTFMLLKVLKEFLKKNPDGIALLFDTEGAYRKEVFDNHGINKKRVLIDDEVTSVEEFQLKVCNFLNKYRALDDVQKKPVIVLLDSLGALLPQAVIDNTDEANSVDDIKGDAGRQAKAKFNALKVVKVKQRQTKVPLYAANHVYNAIGAYVPTKKMSGGSGAEFLSDTIIYLTRSKDRDDKTKEVVGNKIKAVTDKNRYAKPFREVVLSLNFDGGLQRYGGLLELAVSSGLVKKVSNKYQFPNGASEFESKIEQNPEKFFTQEFLEELEKHVAPLFKYSSSSESLQETNNSIDQGKASDEEE